MGITQIKSPPVHDGSAVVRFNTAFWKEMMFGSSSDSPRRSKTLQAKLFPDEYQRLLDAVARLRQEGYRASVSSLVRGFVLAGLRGLEEGWSTDHP